jgi:hypothetical protein
MRSSAEALPSIRQRLLKVLLWPALVLLLAGALIDFLSGVSPVGVAYDHALIDAALAVAAHVRTGTNGSLVVDLPSSTTGGCAPIPRTRFSSASPRRTAASSPAITTCRTCWGTTAIPHSATVLSVANPSGA